MVRASMIRVREGSGNRRVRKNGPTINQVTLLKVSSSHIESVKMGVAISK